MHKDKVFNEEIQKAEDFKFDTTVANVFDDMVSRSVPFYGEMQRMMSEQAADGKFIMGTAAQQMLNKSVLPVLSMQPKELHMVVFLLRMGQLLMI